jgi:hypothetical protein
VAVNLIVLAVTLLMAAFLAVWVFLPQFRAWMEMPKHRFLEQQRQFPEVRRNEELEKNEPTGEPGQ